jgi:hypothetical protein
LKAIKQTLKGRHILTAGVSPLKQMKEHTITSPNTPTRQVTNQALLKGVGGMKGYNFYGQWQNVVTSNK